MPELDDLGEYLSRTLDLPVAGKTYRVPSPPARVGLRLQAGWAVTAARRAGVDPKQHQVRILATDDGSTSLEQDALGPVYDEMLADGVTVETITHAGMTAYLWIVAGERAARAWWVAPLGEASRPLRDPSTSTSTGEASTTPTPASTSGTTPPTPNSGDSTISATG